MPEITLDTITDSLADRGWMVAPGFLTNDEARGLTRECEAAWESGGFQRAGVGRADGLAIREDIRRDHVLWLDEAAGDPAQFAWQEKIHALRQHLNRHLFLGLQDYESHFAIYPEGGFYKAHLDRHQNTRSRIVTVILYLNEHWQPGDGGELKMWTDRGEKDGPFEIVEPLMGTVVIFLAGDFWHEVLPSNKPRMSVTGWLRRE